MDRAHRTETPGSRLRALRGLREQRGLSTTEYVIILICIAVIGISAWRSFGSSARDRTARASGEVAGLEATPGQGSGPRGGGIRVARTSSSALDEATADATPPGEEDGGWMSPAFALGIAAVVILAVVARNFQKRGGGGDGGGGGGGGGDGGAG
ncbi:MAG: hypothetical protein U0325_20890 [Polyangiales bacterium]